MQYIMAIVWSFILVTMLNYVVSSVNDVDFNFLHGLYMTIPAESYPLYSNLNSPFISIGLAFLFPI